MISACSFTNKLHYIATSCATVYAWGMFGSATTKSRIEAKAKQYPYWYTDNKIKTIFAPLYNSDPPVWGFDCIGLIKGVLWGFEGDYSKTYGGAVYASCGVPDISADAMIDKCYDVKSDLTDIAAGEYLWMKGHCGVYIGNGKVIESTPNWKNGVQITELSARNWLKHGKLPYVEYDVEDAKGVKDTVTVELSVLKKGSKGEQVKTLQRLLNAFGHKGSNGNVLSVDGDFGTNTDYALRSYQKANGLDVDGICGPQSWNSLLK